MAIHDFNGKKPNVGNGCFIAPSAEIIGNVEIGEGSSIWYNAVLRGDMNSIKIGKNVSIQDNSTIHTSLKTPTEIADDVVIGHNAIIHSARIEGMCIIGMGAILLSDCRIGKHTIIGAGSVVTEGTIIPEGSIVMGLPGKVVKQTTAEHIKRIRENVDEYIKLNNDYIKKNDR